MRPVIALVGRPNVGKSTLFNRLTRSRDALVANIPGLTRDRQYGQGVLGDRPYIVIDTGGITGDEQGIDFEMASQSLQAIEEADAVLFLVDAKDGLTPVDASILDHLRKKNKTAYLVVNKVDGLSVDQALADFYATGMEQLFPITATQGRGVSKMMDKVLSAFPLDEDEQDELEEGPESIKIAIAGCPNVGKSTLVNRMLGEERVVVYDQPGTTRDSIYIPFERHGRHYTLIDTAGIRRRGKTREVSEKFSVVKSLQSIQDSNVVVMVLDARKGLVEQDMHLLDYVIQAGRGLVIALNKWDGMDVEQRDQVKSDIKRRLAFADFARVHFISALHGTGVGDLYKSIHKAYQSARKELSTNLLTRVLQAATSEHAPPTVNNRRIKLRYAHTGGHNPPIVVIHGKQTDKLPDSYRRYLEKYFRNALKLEGTPIRIELKSSENPFTEKEKHLTPQQVAQKRRIKKNRQARKVRA
ncbi:MAG: ribosome biogenesis GTPase Der [Gammaproteobacteria bacterium]|nr:ribosome biogenesis GTPase Der [Gammaproteobacteria bacterium]